MQTIYSSCRGRDMKRESFSANVIMLINGIIFPTWDSGVNYWICHIDTLDILRNSPWIFNNKLLQIQFYWAKVAFMSQQSCFLFIILFVMALYSFFRCPTSQNAQNQCGVAILKLYLSSSFCDKTFQRNPQSEKEHALFM